MTAIGLETLKQEDQMNIVPASSYIESDSELKILTETVYESESNEFSVKGKNLVDEEEESEHNENMQSEHPR